MDRYVWHDFSAEDYIEWYSNNVTPLNSLEQTTYSITGDALAELCKRLNWLTSSDSVFRIIYENRKWFLICALNTTEYLSFTSSQYGPDWTPFIYKLHIKYHNPSLNYRVEDCYSEASTLLSASEQPNTKYSNIYGSTLPRNPLYIKEWNYAGWRKTNSYRIQGQSTLKKTWAGLPDNLQRTTSASDNSFATSTSDFNPPMPFASYRGYAIPRYGTTSDNNESHNLTGLQSIFDSGISRNFTELGGPGYGYDNTISHSNTGPSAVGSYKNNYDPQWNLGLYPLIVTDNRNHSFNHNVEIYTSSHNHHKGTNTYVKTQVSDGMFAYIPYNKDVDKLILYIQPDVTYSPGLRFIDFGGSDYVDQTTEKLTKVTLLPWYGNATSLIKVPYGVIAIPTYNGEPSVAVSVILDYFDDQKEYVEYANRTDFDVASVECLNAFWAYIADESNYTNSYTDLNLTRVQSNTLWADEWVDGANCAGQNRFHLNIMVPLSLDVTYGDLKIRKVSNYLWTMRPSARQLCVDNTFFTRFFEDLDENAAKPYKPLLESTPSDYVSWNNKDTNPYKSDTKTTRGFVSGRDIIKTTSEQKEFVYKNAVELAEIEVDGCGDCNIEGYMKAYLGVNQVVIHSKNDQLLDCSKYASYLSYWYTNNGVDYSSGFMPTPVSVSDDWKNSNLFSYYHLDQGETGDGNFGDETIQLVFPFHLDNWNYNGTPTTGSITIKEIGGDLLSASSISDPFNGTSYDNKLRRLNAMFIEADLFSSDVDYNAVQSFLSTAFRYLRKTGSYERGSQTYYRYKIERFQYSYNIATTGFWEYKYFDGLKSYIEPGLSLKQTDVLCTTGGLKNWFTDNGSHRSNITSEGWKFPTYYETLVTNNSSTVCGNGMLVMFTSEMEAADIIFAPNDNQFESDRATYNTVFNIN